MIFTLIFTLVRRGFHPLTTHLMFRRRGVSRLQQKSPETPAGVIGVRTKLGKWGGGANVRVLRR